MTGKFITYILLFFSFSFNVIAQNDQAEPIEIFLIDAYVTPEIPHQFILSFFTSDSSTSRLLMDGKYNFVVSDKLTEDHKITIDLTDYQFDSTTVPFIINVVSKTSEKFESELYDVTLPGGNDLIKGADQSIFTVCCFGGVVFLLPSPTYVSFKGNSYLSITKEVPLFSFFSKGYNYPAGYVGVEYAYIFNAPVKNFLRVGYKHIIQLPAIEYVAPGINLFTDFNGYNGISPELSVGVLRLYNVFTLYAKYRFNFQPGSTGNEMHEISIGLFSNFFSINL